jgi:nuclear pore complex protein Nup98-Nup96
MLPLSFSWHLYSVLQALHFQQLSPYHAASLHMNYASQLESVGLWHWAVFPLLHIHDTKQ